MKTNVESREYLELLVLLLLLFIENSSTSLSVYLCIMYKQWHNQMHPPKK